MLPSPAAVRAATLGPTGSRRGSRRARSASTCRPHRPALARELAAALAAARHRRARRAGLGRHDRRRGRDADDHGRRRGGGGRARATAASRRSGSSSCTSASTGSARRRSSATTSAPASTWRPSPRPARWRGSEGLDPAVLYELMTSSTGDSRVLRTRFPARVDHPTPAADGFAPMFTVDLMEKDLALAEQLAAEHGLETEPLAAALALYRRAQGRATARSTTRRSRSRRAGRSCERAIEQLIEQLRAELAVQRVTVRVAVPDAVFPVALRGARAGRRQPARRHDRHDRQPVPRVLAEQDGQVVQEDSAAAFPDDAGFHAMRERFGGMRAQIVTGCYRDGELVALLSIHDLRAPRASARPSGGRCRAAATAIAELLDDAARAEAARSGGRSPTRPRRATTAGTPTCRRRSRSSPATRSSSTAATASTGRSRRPRSTPTSRRSICAAGIRCPARSPCAAPSPATCSRSRSSRSRPTASARPP